MMPWCSNISPLETYNSLTDRHLVNYFRSARMRKHLINNGLITANGEIVPETEYREISNRENQKRALLEIIAHAIVERSLEVERIRQGKLRRNLEDICRLHRVRQLKEERRKRAEETVLTQLVPRSPRITEKLAPLQISESNESTDLKDPVEVAKLQNAYQHKQAKKHKPRQAPYLYLWESDLINRAKSELNNLLSRDTGTGRKSEKISRVNRKSHSKEKYDSGQTVDKNKQKRGKLCSHGKKSTGERGDRILAEESTDSNNQTNEQVLPPLMETMELVKSPCIVKFMYLGMSHSEELLIPHQSDFDKNKSSHPNQSTVRFITVIQQPSGGNTIPVFKGLLQPGDIFEITSRRMYGFPFSLSFSIDGTQDARISSCCEYRHRRGTRIGGRAGHFVYLSVEGSIPCYRCQMAQTVRQERLIKHKKKKESPNESINTPNNADHNIPAHLEYPSPFITLSEIKNGILNSTAENLPQSAKLKSDPNSYVNNNLENNTRCNYSPDDKLDANPSAHVCETAKQEWFNTNPTKTFNQHSDFSLLGEHSSEMENEKNIFCEQEYEMSLTTQSLSSHSSHLENSDHCADISKIPKSSINESTKCTVENNHDITQIFIQHHDNLTNSRINKNIGSNSKENLDERGNPNLSNEGRTPNNREIIRNNSDPESISQESNVMQPESNDSNDESDDSSLGKQSLSHSEKAIQKVNTVYQYSNRDLIMRPKSNTNYTQHDYDKENLKLSKTDKNEKFTDKDSVKGAFIVTDKNLATLQLYTTYNKESTQVLESQNFGNLATTNSGGSDDRLNKFLNDSIYSKLNYTHNEIQNNLKMNENMLKLNAHKYDIDRSLAQPLDLSNFKGPQIISNTCQNFGEQESQNIASTNPSILKNIPHNDRDTGFESFSSENVMDKQITACTQPVEENSQKFQKTELQTLRSNTPETLKHPKSLLNDDKKHFPLTKLGIDMDSISNEILHNHEDNPHTNKTLSSYLRFVNNNLPSIDKLNGIPKILIDSPSTDNPSFCSDELEDMRLMCQKQKPIDDSHVDDIYENDEFEDEDQKEDSFLLENIHNDCKSSESIDYFTPNLISRHGEQFETASEATITTPKPNDNDKSNFYGLSVVYDTNNSTNPRLNIDDNTIHNTNQEFNDNEDKQP